MPQAIVIDDSPLIRAQLKQILTRLDCRVVAEAGSGDDLGRLYNLHKPDLVTLDIVMPGKDGLTAAVELMREHPTAKIVMCTSLTTRDKILAAQRAGVSHYLLKPFDPARAEQILRFALAERETRTRSRECVMNCPRCQRLNGPQRRYCGDCGTNLEPVCRACGFENETRDRYCGGCGCGLTQQIAAPPVAAVVAPVAAPPRVRTVAMPPPPPPPPVKHVAPAAPTHELDGLFASPAAVNDGPKLPDANISQDDLDRLFGAIP